MRQCRNCFVLNRQDAVRCVRCGAVLAPRAPLVAPLKFRAEPRLRRFPPLSKDVPVALPSTSRGTVSKSLMYALGLLLLFLVPLLLSLEWGGATARPGPGEAEHALPPQDLRRQQIVEAAALLQQQLDSLEALLQVGPNRPAGKPLAAALSGWQSEMERIKATYRIWGVVDAQHPDAGAEDALRNAYLYLHSLKHVASTDPNWETNPEYHRIRDDFTSSLSRAVR